MRFVLMLATLAAVAYGLIVFTGPSPGLPGAGAAPGGSAAAPTNRPAQRMYRWRDRRGSLVISDSPPPEGVEAEVLEYRDAGLIRPDG